MNKKNKKSSITGQDGKLTVPMKLSLVVGGAATMALILGPIMPPNSVAQKICIGVVLTCIWLVVLLWVIAKIKTYVFYNKWKAEQEKQESRQAIKKKGKK